MYHGEISAKVRGAFQDISVAKRQLEADNRAAQGKYRATIEKPQELLADLKRQYGRIAFHLAEEQGIPPVSAGACLLPTLVEIEVNGIALHWEGDVPSECYHCVIPWVKILDAVSKEEEQEA